jgi:glycosyltransferase involved in cell wall biosynthesis
MEIVIADDASSDGAQEIIRQYQEKYPHKIKAKLSQKNQGTTKNANWAHFNCKGKYITFLAGDDLCLPGKIRKQVEYMEAHPECSISYHNAEIFDSYSAKRLAYYNNRRMYAHEGGVEKLFVYGFFNGPFSMARRDMVPRRGFNEQIPISSDWLYCMETLMQGGEVHYINEVLARYRRHEGNITMTEPTIIMFWEKMLSVFFALLKCPRLIKYIPALIKDVFIRLSQNINPPEGVVIIKGRSLLRAYASPE